jgi:hypothetical protein
MPKLITYYLLLNQDNTRLKKKCVKNGTCLSYGIHGVGQNFNVSTTNWQGGEALMDTYEEG